MEEIQFEQLIDNILSNRESEFVELKTSNDEPHLFGSLISALANGAKLVDKEEAYLVYGINNDGKPVGTEFNPYKSVKSQPFINLIHNNLRYCGKLAYRKGVYQEKDIVVVIIPAATTYPVEYNKIAYIRVDSAKKKLQECPELNRELWAKIIQTSFEDRYASKLVTEEKVFELLDFSPYYSRREQEMPSKRQTVIDSMLNEGVITKKIGQYYITNLGALLFAKDLSKFPHLIDREIRLIKYHGNNKIDVERSMDFSKGYALAIDEVAEKIELLLPAEEYIDKMTRKTNTVFDSDIIRELLPNELIHQDFSVDGYCPRIEIYNNRVEFSNSGTPVIDTSRFLDLNRSRNPKLAKLARFMRMCEERGMGIDKVEFLCEKTFLPSPNVTASDGITRVIIFGHKTLRQFTQKDKINLVYMQCCFLYINHQHLTNEFLRHRFPEGVMSPTVASRWIKEAVESGVIQPFDSNASRKNTSYVPSWSV